MKPVRSIFLVLTVVMLGLMSCTQSSDCFQADIFCAALVTDVQGLDDHGMNQDSWAGLEKAKADGIVQRVEYIESIDTRDYEKNIAYFAKQGFDVIVTVGAGMSDETLLAADLKPESPQEAVPVFMGMDQPYDEIRPNLISVTFPEDQMGFLAGALAARISETQIVGAVCETSGIDSMWRYCEGFRAGVMFLNQLKGQNTKALVVYRENGDREKLFLDEAWGYDTAQGLIQRGTDVIFAAGGLTGEGALRAAAEAGVRSIGAERDQQAALAGSDSEVVTSILGDASFEIQEVLHLLGDGNVPEPRSGKFRYVPLNQTFPENLTKEMDVLLLSLVNGEIKTNVTLSKP